jgi:WhiB family redox-sensing transcriptional regulator
MNSITTAHKRNIRLQFAACQEEDPELFFPVGTGPTVFQIEEAKGVCFSCPLLERCADGALNRREKNGVWGGLDEDDRRWLLRRLPKGRAWADLPLAERRELLRAVGHRRRSEPLRAA